MIECYKAIMIELCEFRRLIISNNDANYLYK